MSARHLRLVFRSPSPPSAELLRRHPIHVLTYSPPGFWFEHRAQRRCGAPSRRKGIHICVYPRTTAHVTYANDVSALRAVASSALGIEWALRIACRRSLLLREGGGTRPVRALALALRTAKPRNGRSHLRFYLLIVTYAERTTDPRPRGRRPRSRPSLRRFAVRDRSKVCLCSGQPHVRALVRTLGRSAGRHPSDSPVNVQVFHRRRPGTGMRNVVDGRLK